MAAEGELPAVSASVIFVSVHEERTTEVWMQLIQKWLQVCSDLGLQKKVDDKKRKKMKKS